MPCKATQGGWVTVQTSNETWSNGGGNGNPLHQFLIAKFRLKLKKAGKTTRPVRYDLNQIPYEYTWR